jgi:hypothetical protein
MEQRLQRDQCSEWLFRLVTTIWGGWLVVTTGYYGYYTIKKCLENNKKR